MLKLNVGHSRKVGEPNFGSRGASVQLEMEVESNLVAKPDDLKARIRRLFQLARESVTEELSGDSERPPVESDSHQQKGGSSSYSNGHSRSPRQATASQLRAVRAISGKNRLDLGGILRQRFNVTSEDELSISAASELIDFLKAESQRVTS